MSGEGDGARLRQPPTAERAVVDNVLTREDCLRLIALHRMLGVPGYRENLTATCFREVFATGATEHLMTLVKARECVREVAETSFDLLGDLFFEFTGVMCWGPGGYIQSHADKTNQPRSNRPYLKQRAYSAVLYLNSQGEDFSGGDFVFENGDGSYETIAPKEGRLVLFESGASNMHRVDPILAGERYTFVVWFTKDISHNQDPPTIAQLKVLMMNSDVCFPHPVQLGRLVDMGLATYDESQDDYAQSASVTENGRAILQHAGINTQDTPLDRQLCSLLRIHAAHQPAACSGLERAAAWAQLVEESGKALRAVIPRWCSHQAIYYDGP